LENPQSRWRQTELLQVAFEKVGRLEVSGWQQQSRAAGGKVSCLEVAGWQQGRAGGKVGRLEVSGWQQGRANGKVGC
jgi:hypothetical protein